MSRPRRFRVFVARPVLGLLLLSGLFTGWRYEIGNTGTIIPGRAYRSGQLGPRGITGMIRDHGIQTVINLRGTNPDQRWYQAERAAVLDAGATLVDIPLASDHWLSRGQARTLTEVLDRCARPFLIHCEWGAERTGLVAAWTELLRPGGSLASARDQFSIYYLFLPIKDGPTMRGHLDRYEDWLTDRGATHDPALFRLWATQEYRPGYPSRDDWMYDPYPLVQITEPSREATARNQAGVHNELR